VERRGIELFRDYHEVEAYLRWRFEPVTSLVTEIREAADSAVAIEVIDDGWRAGCDLNVLGKICDGVLFCAYDRTPAAVGTDVATVRSMLPPQCRLGVGMRVFYPEMGSARDVVERTQAAIQAGATDLHYYNYGLVPAARLDWVRAAVDAVKA
jgi:hypothetical protein